jgi:hypothetical protein
VQHALPLDDGLGILEQPVRADDGAEVRLAATEDDRNDVDDTACR